MLSCFLGTIYNLFTNRLSCLDKLDLFNTICINWFWLHCVNYNRDGDIVIVENCSLIWGEQTPLAAQLPVCFPCVQTWYSNHQHNLGVAVIMWITGWEGVIAQYKNSTRECKVVSINKIRAKGGERWDASGAASWSQHGCWVQVGTG